MEQSIGTYINKKRKEQHMTLQKLAEETGLSVGYLSLLERGMNSPTIANLHKICRAINTTMIELFSGLENDKYLVRKEDRKIYYEEPGKLRYETMIDGDRLLVCTSMTAYDDEEHTPGRHITDEFGIIIQGSLAMTLEDSSFEMREGDSVYIPAGSFHSFHRTGDGPCVSYWVSPSSKDFPK